MTQSQSTLLGFADLEQHAVDLQRPAPTTPRQVEDIVTCDWIVKELIKIQIVKQGDES